jgi:phosphoribosylformylglycinamidine cyclo-ligase
MAKLTYKAAGVDSEAQDDFADSIGRMASGLRTPEVISGIGGFAAAVAPDLTGMKRPLLVSGTDGVGTKLKLAFATGIHDTVGIDLVAMCVNDVLTTGARPLFFLDYFATGRLEKGVALKVIAGIVEGCRRARCALVGGETAELPGFYAEGEYDLAGFSVGVVDEPALITGASCKAGDILLGLPSSGVHSNGFSLVRKVIETQGWSLDHVFPGFDRPLGEALLTPTVLYTDAVSEVTRAVPVKAMAHITGGGLEGNLPRVLPDDVHPLIDRGSIPPNPVFPLIRSGGVDDSEMWAVFNMGVGFVVVISPEHSDAAIAALAKADASPFVLGRLVAGGGDVEWT